MLAVPKMKDNPNSKAAVVEGSVKGADAAVASVPTTNDDASNEDPPNPSHDSSLNNTKTRERLEEEDAANQTKKRKTKDDATAEATSSCSEGSPQQEDEKETNKDDEQGLLAASAEGGPGLAASSGMRVPDEAQGMRAARPGAATVALTGNNFSTMMNGAPSTMFHSSNTGNNYTQQPHPHSQSQRTLPVQHPLSGNYVSDAALLQQLERQNYLASLMGNANNNNNSVDPSVLSTAYGPSAAVANARRPAPPPPPQAHMEQYLQQQLQLQRFQPHQQPSMFTHPYGGNGGGVFDFHLQQQPAGMAGDGFDPYRMTAMGSMNHPMMMSAAGGYPYPGGFPGGPAAVGYGSLGMGSLPPYSSSPAGFGLSLNQVLAQGAPTATLAPDGFPVSLPAILARPEDEFKLSSHQLLLRHQIEAFPAAEEDVSTHTRGRNKPILLGQVGIRCRHCAHLPVTCRQKGSTYFPASLLGLYQAAQNMSTTHMQCGLCREMPNLIKHQFAHLISTKVASSGAGRPYWAESAKKLGLVDTEGGIRFFRDLQADATAKTRSPDKASTTTNSAN